MQILLAFLFAYFTIGILIGIETGLERREVLYQSEPNPDLWSEFGYWGAIVLKVIPGWPFYL